MKKFIVIMLALFLAVPAITYAGTVTSRYDVTIGGYVKFDMGYNDKGVGADFNTPTNAFGFNNDGTTLGVSGNRNKNLTDEYGNFFSAAGETALNFLIKGPDGWGAKTSAFIEGDFEGVWAGAEYGVFTLRHAFMRFDWGNAKLTMGQTWQAFGLLPTYGGQLFSFAGLTPFMKGARQPQIYVNYNLNKNWAFMVGIMSPTSTLRGTQAANGMFTGGTVVNQYTRTGLPFAEGEITWTSDACGKIGPWQMLFGLGGHYGQVKQAVEYVNAAGNVSTKDDESPSWSAIFKGYIPIIPEKKGNKTGAFALSGAAMMGQNWSWMNPGPTAWTPINSDYWTGAGSNIRSASPTVYGGWGQLTYYFADNVFVNGYYGYMTANLSQAYRTSAFAAGNLFSPKNVQHIIANICYDVNPAVRLGFEYANIYARYSNINNVAGNRANNQNTVNSFRIGAYYFF